MTKKLVDEIASHDQLIAGLEKQIDLQEQMIRQQQLIIRTMEEHNNDLSILIQEILHP